GLLGSSRRGKAIFDLLRQDGVTDAALERVRVPIGLDLGAQSAPEIALAIVAEVLAVQRGRTGPPISEKVRKGIGGRRSVCGGPARGPSCSRGASSPTTCAARTARSRSARAR